LLAQIRMIILSPDVNGMSYTLVSLWRA